MDHVNFLKQAAHDLRNEFRSLLDIQSEGKLSDEQKARSTKLAALLPKAEQAVLDEEKRLAVEDAQLRTRASARGMTSLGIPYGDAYGRMGAAGDDAPALALPPLPSRTRAAITRLYPQAQASADGEERAAQWRGLLGAVLGGQSLHPAVAMAMASEGVPSEGGFMVTAEVAAGLFMRGIEESVFARIGARVEPMTSEEKVVQAVDDADETDDAEGGLTGAWKGEGEDFGDPQILKIRQVKLTSRKLVLLAAASNSLAEDAPDYVTALEAAMGRAIGKKLDRSVLNGTGAGQPLGLLNSVATIVVSKEAGQPAATFKWENATKMWARLAPGSHERAWWLINPTVLPAGLSMQMVIGTGGTQPRGAFETGGPTGGYMLLGRPVLVTGRVKVLGTKGDVILVDPTQIAIGIRKGIAIDRSPHAYFTSDRLAIRGRFRGDARPFWEKARTLPEGTTTVSPIVVLETRS